MTGYGGCNNIFSDYVAKDEKISFGPIASTRMYCEGLMELEGSFMRALDTSPNTRSLTTSWYYPMKTLQQC